MWMSKKTENDFKNRLSESSVLSRTFLKGFSATAEDSSDVHEKFEIFFVIELIYLVFNFSKK